MLEIRGVVNLGIPLEKAKSLEKTLSTDNSFSNVDQKKPGGIRKVLYFSVQNLSENSESLNVYLILVA